MSLKPSSTEEEFFVREEAERKRRLVHEHQRKLAEEERRRLRELHHLHCPKCGLKMEEIKFRGLDVEVCFGCNGIFLDKGEIDEIAAPQQKGIMAAILNWFSDESKAPGAKK